MPEQSVQQFLKQVSSDQSLQEELKQALETDNKREAVTELAQSKGYNFSPDELWEEVQKRQNEAQAKKEAGELSDEELEAVAGGEFAVSGAVISATSAVASASVAAVTGAAADKANDAW